MYNEFIQTMVIIIAFCWTAMSMHMLYTTIRDDIRRERERKEKKQ